MQIEFSEEVREWFELFAPELSLKPDAPEHIKKEFNETMKIIKSSYNVDTEFESPE